MCLSLFGYQTVERRDPLPQNKNIPRNFILGGEGSGHGARQRTNLFPRKRVHTLLISGPAEDGI